MTARSARPMSRESWYIAVPPEGPTRRSSPSRNQERAVPSKQRKHPYSGLTQLGARTELPSSPAAAVLERVANPHPSKQYLVRFTAPEFTSLCPITGQPDFARLVIDYVPRRFLVESK